MLQDLKYWVALSRFGKIGPKKFHFLRQRFLAVQNIWEADFRQLRDAGLDEKTAGEFILKRKEIDPNAEMELLAKENVSAVTIDDGLYPKLLKEIYHPPFILYYKGAMENLTDQAIAVVGTRQVSQYGRRATQEITEALADQGIVIVSGLALGVDSIAHLAAVKKGKVTAAVLGSGLDAANIYPAMHRSLANEILHCGGLLVSEYPIGTLPLKHNFPARNRIISGLALGTLVIEAGEHSGALITAHSALEQNREVFAIPGPITSPLSVGTNNLIKKGAKLVCGVSDIFDELNLKQIKEFRDNREIIPDTPEEAAILKHLMLEPRHINELVRLTDLSASELNSALMKLEMKGQIKNLGNMTFVVSR